MQRHRALHRGLRVELRRKADLEQHVFHHVAAERLRQRERLALEQHVLETPGLRAQRRWIAHFALQREQRVAHRAAGGIAGRPALARTGVRRVTIGAQRAAVDPRVRQRVHDLLERAAEHRRGHRGRRHAHQQHVIETDAVEAVLERQHALDFVRLDHGGEDVAHRQRLLAQQNRAARQIVREREDGAEVVGRMAPFRRQPGVVEVEPAHHGADAERAHDRIQLVAGARHARPAGHRGARHHRA